MTTPSTKVSAADARGSRRRIDLNADMGEGFGPWLMGDDEAMFALVSSANIACGGHASDPETMFRTLTLARQNDVVTGAHPSYPDKEGFGRRRLPHSPAEIERFVAAQVGALVAIGTLVGQPIAYVKPHGALGNVATADTAIAGAIVAAIRAVDPGLAMLAIRALFSSRSRATTVCGCSARYSPIGDILPLATSFPAANRAS